MQKKTLLQINVSANAGSTGKIAEQIGVKAINNGWDSYIAYGKRSNCSKSTLIKIGSKWDLYNHGLQSRLFDNHGLASVNPTKRFIQKIDSLKPDIIHLHNIHDYYINYRILFDYLASIDTPVIWTLHDCWPFTGHCAYFDYLQCEKWKTHCEKCPGLRTYPQSLFCDKSKRNFDFKRESFLSVVDRLTIVPVSFWIEDFVKQSFLRKAHIETIHNGIDLKLFTPLETTNVKKHYSIPEGLKIVLGVAAPWSKRKGFDDFIKLRELLNDDYVIVLVGLSKKQIGKLPKGIVGISRTENQKELVELYSSASVFVNPTYEDNYPTTNLEALACGCPVVTYNTGGGPEAVTDNTGLIVDKGDVHALYEAIIMVSNKENLTLRTNCRNWAVNNCDSDRVYNRYLDLYNRLIKFK